MYTRKEGLTLKAGIILNGKLVFRKVVYAFTLFRIRPTSLVVMLVSSDMDVVQLAFASSVGCNS